MFSWFAVSSDVSQKLTELNMNYQSVSYAFFIYAYKAATIGDKTS